jgi:hypothetical protein
MNRILFAFTFFFNIIFVCHAQLLPVCFSETKSVSTISVQSNPYSIVTADFNNDGRKDIAVGHSNSNIISILLGSASGDFIQGTDILPFTIGPTYMGLYKPQILGTSDFNNDGKADLISFDFNGSSLMIILGNGNGTFSYHNLYTTGGNRSTGVTMNDFNNDGNMDFAVSSSISNNTSVFIGDGTGNFAAPQIFPAGSAPQAINSVDINHDGNIDLAVANYSSSNVSILLGTGTGSFVANGTYPTGLGAYSIATGDFNNDTHADFAVVNQYVNTLSVLFGNGLGGFLPTVNYTVGLSPRAVATADLNGDGFLDITLTSETSNQVDVLMGSASGNFTKTYEFGVGSHPFGLVAKDLDGDNKVDVAVTNHSGNTVSILKGTGTGMFSAPLSFEQGSRPSMFSIADFNLDGKNDLAFSSLTSNFVSVLLSNGNGNYNNTSTYSVGTSSQYCLVANDFNGDGNTDIIVAGKILLGTASGTFSTAQSTNIYVYSSRLISGDFNNDGKADVANNSGVYLGVGNGTFLNAINYPSNHNLMHMTSKDFNGDGNADIVGYSSLAGTILFFAGDGLGGFTLSGNIIVNSASYENIASADFNKDGFMDIVSCNLNTNNVAILMGLGSGNFSAAANYSVTNLQNGLTIADYNGDDNLDVAVSGSTNVMLLLGSTSGVFSAGLTYDLGVAPGAINSGDLNEDGRADLVVSNTSIYKLSVLLNGSSSIGVSTTSLCIGNSLTLIAGSVGTYTWNTGATTNSISVNPVITSTYSAIESSAIAGCGNTASKSFIVIIDSLPVINITLGSTTVCMGSSDTLIATGANSYTWSTGATTPGISVTPLVSSTYTITGINLCGNNTQTISVTVDPTCQDVWPGDANSDGLADNLDVLELGLHYVQTGAPRLTTSNAWQSYFANNWGGTITNGKNLNHSDCNGDGTINDDDTLAIYNNYALIHSFKPAQINVVNPQLSIVPDQISVAKGSWGTASIYAGDAITSIINMNGLAFTINFDNNLIESSNMYIEYQNSFLDAGQNLHFRKLDFANNKLFTATTHTVSNNVSGYGLIAKLHYQIKSGLTTDEVLNLGISQANQSDASGVITPLTSGTGTLMAIGASVGLQELNGNIVFISPNPTNGSITINSKTELQKIEVVSITGQVLLIQIPSNVSHTLYLENFSNGIYFVNVYQNDRIIKREKIVLNK